MKEYTIPVEWTIIGAAKIQANSLDEAATKAEEMPLEAFNGEYCDSSFKVNYEYALEMPENEDD